MKTRKPLSILLTLALVLGLLPWTVMPARAEARELTSSTTEWSGECTVSSEDVTISGNVTVTADTVLTIAEGKTLTVNGTITVGGGSGTLTVKGPGKLAINGGNGSVSVGAGGAGGSGVKGNLTVTGGTLTVTGGSGGYGSSAGGAGGDGVSGKVTVNGGELTVTGGRGGGSSFTGGSGGVGVSGDVIVNSGSAAITGGVGGCTSESGAGGVGVSGKVTVNGGELTVTGGSGGDSSTAYNDCFGGAGGVGLNGTVTLAGGTLTVNGGAGGTAGGSSGAAGKAFGDNAGVTVEDGCGYTDGTSFYTGTLTGGQIEELNGVTLRPCEAKLGENGYYPTLAEAFDAAVADQTVTLLADVKTDTSLTVAAGKDFTLDLNGHTIDRGLAGKDSAINGSVITVSDTLTLTDSSQDKTGTITGGNTAQYGGGVYVDNNGAFTMIGGTISGNAAAGGGVYVGNDCAFTMEGGTISGNTATNGGGVHVGTNGAFAMSGGTISGNTAGSNGGGVYVYNDALGFTMIGGTISGNTANCGGGVYLESFGGFEMTGGVITGNNAGTDGGGVNCYMCSITVGGRAVIRDNVKGGAKDKNGVYAGGTASNALLGTNYDNSVFKPIIVGSSPLTKGAHIGVTMPPSFAASAFTSGWSTRMSEADPDDFFKSDDARYAVMRNDGGEAELRLLNTVTVENGTVKNGTVENGTADKATAAQGATVKVTANAPAAGKVFDKWTTTDGVTFADAGKAQTTFTMPAQAVAVTATYHDYSLANGKVYAPKGAVLILATYSGGRMTGMQSVTINADCADKAPSSLGLTVPASGYKLMLVDGSTYAPLCPAWEG